jgi:serine/threonine protein kinase
MPRELGRLRLQRVVGGDAMGNVHEAFDPDDGRRVAVRVFPADAFPVDAGARERLSTAASAALGLQHPGIVELHDFGWEGDTAFVATAFVEGETLAQYLARVGRLPALQGLALALQLLSALAFAHERGLVHSALHPQHVLVGRNGQLKIAGFGWVAAAASAGRRPGVFDAPAYMAPEQILGRPADHRADLYSAAVMAYELLAGAWPYQAHAAPRPPRELRPELPMGVDAVFERAQAQSPDARYPSAAAFAAALQGAFGTPVWERAVVPSRPAHVEEPDDELAFPPPPGSRAGVAMAAGFAAAVVLGAVFVAVESARGPVERSEPVVAAPIPPPPARPPVEAVPAAASFVAPKPEVRPEPEAPPPRPKSQRAEPRNRATPERPPASHRPPKPELHARSAPAPASRPAPPSPHGECRQERSMARELCVAFECATAEYRHHPVCVRMHAEAVVRHKLAERNGP